MNRLIFRKQKRQRGALLALTLVMVVVAAMLATGTYGLARYSARTENRNLQRVQARYNAEAAIQQAIHNIAFDTTNFNDSALTNTISWTKNQTPAATQTVMDHFPEHLDALTVNISNPNSGVSGNFVIEATATVGDIEQTVSSLVRKNPPSKVFDFEYFLNNWGWWWGSSITGNGDQRSNGRFDARYGPEVNGSLGAQFGVFSDYTEWAPGDSFGADGLAGDNPDDYITPYINPLQMPNLSDISVYEAQAMAAGSSVSYKDSNTNNTQTLSGVHNGDLYLYGNPANPVVIDGPFVVTGNLIIHGTISGKGTLYAGRNIYITGNIDYANAPATERPASNDPAVRDAWVADNNDKDLVAFAATENVLFGNVNSESTWKYPWYNYLRKWGDESQVGEDGIPDTSDDGASFDRDGDGTLDGAWYDIDGDGVVDNDYQWADDIAPGRGLDNSSSSWYKAGDVSHYTNWPKTGDGDPLNYNSVNSTVSRINGIFYTNHAFAGRSGNTTINGSVISKDEAVIFGGGITMNYDERVHSRYNNDPNNLINLGLPVANVVTMLSWQDGKM